MDDDSKLDLIKEVINRKSKELAENNDLESIEKLLDALKNEDHEYLSKVVANDKKIRALLSDIDFDTVYQSMIEIEPDKFVKESDSNTLKELSYEVDVLTFSKINKLGEERVKELANSDITLDRIETLMREGKTYNEAAHEMSKNLEEISNEDFEKNLTKKLIEHENKVKELPGKKRVERSEKILIEALDYAIKEHRSKKATQWGLMIVIPDEEYLGFMTAVINLKAKGKIKESSYQIEEYSYQGFKFYMLRQEELKNSSKLKLTFVKLNHLRPMLKQAINMSNTIIKKIF